MDPMNKRAMAFPKDVFDFMASRPDGMTQAETMALKVIARTIKPSLGTSTTTTPEEVSAPDSASLASGMVGVALTSEANLECLIEMFRILEGEATAIGKEFRSAVKTEVEKRRDGGSLFDPDGEWVSRQARRLNLIFCLKSKEPMPARPVLTVGREDVPAHTDVDAGTDPAESVAG